MNLNELKRVILQKRSFLCVGLDSDIRKIPEFLHDFDNPVFEFNKRIIDATRDYCVAYKPNTAFYECYGSRGWETLERTIQYIGKTHFIIADAKRGDIGNTSDMYARAFFETLKADSVTITPYMGQDSVSPFLKYEDKYAILLALTSNTGASDFQDSQTKSEELFEKVLRISKTWLNNERLMYVVGATRAERLKEVRQIIGDSFILVPGVGAQGGSLSDVYTFGHTPEVGLLVNASRSILYAGNCHIQSH
jgi:orotidine-5'-phosphate decarboxylase